MLEVGGVVLYAFTRSENLPYKMKGYKMKTEICLVFKGEELGQFERVGWFTDRYEALENSHEAIFEAHEVYGENKKQLHARVLRLIMTREKTLRGCEWAKLGIKQSCANELFYYQLQFSHKQGVTKYTSTNGKIVHPSDLASRGVSISTLLNEINKCDILCANCHAIVTFQNERNM
jgi:hypothetical protein